VVQIGLVDYGFDCYYSINLALRVK